MSALPYLSDAEISGICRPLRQHMAQIRYLRSLGLTVYRRPDGSPLVNRADWDKRFSSPQKAPSANAPRWSK